MEAKRIGQPYLDDYIKIIWLLGTAIMHANTAVHLHKTQNKNLKERQQNE